MAARRSQWRSIRERRRNGGFSPDRLSGAIQEIFIAAWNEPGRRKRARRVARSRRSTGASIRTTANGVPRIRRKAESRRVNPRGRPHIVTAPAAQSWSMATIRWADRRRLCDAAAIDRARETKAAFVAVRGSNHCGALDRWVLRAASEGMVGLASTNAAPDDGAVGGRDKIVAHELRSPLLSRRRASRDRIGRRIRRHCAR